MMDFTTLDKLKNALRPETWKQINRRLAEYAVRREQASGEALRLDTTAVETNIHWPTDSSLLWDTYRVLARRIEQAREIDAEAVGTERLHLRRAKREHLAITRKAAKRGTDSETLKPLYRALLGRVEGICEWALRVAEKLVRGIEGQRYGAFEHATAEALVEEIAHYGELGRRVIDQARRRVFQGESVPNEEKLFSVFEPHTELLKRGKAGKYIEFGHMIQIQQVREKFITDYEAYERKPVEHQILHDALGSHRSLFGELPAQTGRGQGLLREHGSASEVGDEDRRRVHRQEGQADGGGSGARTRPALPPCPGIPRRCGGIDLLLEARARVVAMLQQGMEALRGHRRRHRLRAQPVGARSVLTPGGLR
jgi:IS5 family transposase